MKPRVLIVDDEVSLCGLLEIFFEKKGYNVASAHNLKDAFQFLDQPEPFMAMVDLSLGTESGLTLVKKLGQRWPELPVVVMTAYGSIERAVEAMKIGAFDFISKPFEMIFLSKVVEKAVSQRSLKDENRNLRSLLKGTPGVELIGNAEVMRRLRQKIDTVAASDSTVLITGESGTGKEVVAKLLHQSSRRRGGPFVVVNCSALSENLLESELFGHVKGSFTSANSDKEGLFAVATQGTVFLDEIGEMPLRTQVKLLRVLQEREITPVGGTLASPIDVRILSATNVDLEKAVEEGKFREDLYYRLNVIRIHTPRLCEREEDAVILANYFLRKNSNGSKKFGKGALDQIRTYDWPGNVRQLENAVERAIAFSPDETIEDLELDSGPLSPSASGAFALASDSSYFPRSNGNPASGAVTPTMSEIEKAYIFWVLTQNNWHKPTAAKILGFDLSTLYRKIEKYGFKQ